MAVACSGGCYCSDFSDLHRFQFPLQYPSSDWIIEEACVLVLARLRECVWAVVCACARAKMAGWSHSPRSPPPSLGGNKNNLAKRDVHIHTHSCTQPASGSKAGNWLEAAEPCYSTHTRIRTRTHMQAQTPISLNLATCLCIRTSSVSPPLGCGVHSEAICVVPPASSSSPSLFPSIYLSLFSFSCMHMRYFFPSFAPAPAFYPPLSSATTRSPLSFSLFHPASPPPG